MRISRLHTEQPLAPDSEIALEPRAAHYLSRVLKLRVGHRLVLFNGDGFDYAAELVSARKEQLTVRVNTRLPAVAESRLPTTLVQAVGKGDRMDYSLQKSTELGVAVVQPLFSDRTEVRLAGARLEKRMAHWRAVLIAACEQCGRAIVPDLLYPLALADWAGARLSAETTMACYVLDPRAERKLAAIPPPAKAGVGVLVGPEGGFTEAELRVLEQADVLPVRLGPRILRTETAGPAALAVLQTLHGDFAPD